MDIDWSKAPVNAVAFISPKSGNESAFYAIKISACDDNKGFVGTKAGGTTFLIYAAYWDVCWRIVYQPQPQEWSGEGLPPVGTVCEFCRFPEKCGAKWSKVAIVAHWEEGLGSPVAIFMSTGYAPQADQAIADRFRPVRTAEQIAAEEREVKSMEIMGIIANERSDAKAAYALYDAGYRKQEQK